MKSTKLPIGMIGALVVSVFGLGAGAAFAATCNVPSGSYPTIQSAINDPSCNPIVVSSGSYAESLNVDRSVTLDGPNVGISPNGGSRVAEATLNGGGSTTIRISTTGPVTIDGFTFSGGTGPMIDSYTSGNTPTIKHNIFTAQVDGFYFNEPAVFTFVDNNLHDLTDCGGCDGIFIAGNWNGFTGTVASIDANVWNTIGSSGMNLSNVSGSITNNHFSFVTYYAALLSNGTNVDVSGNTFDHTINPDLTVRTWGAGVRFYTPTNPGFGARITGNTFTNNYVGIGVRMGSPTADITGLDVHAHQNNFTGNTAAGIRNDGLGTFDGTCNWWGSASGPGPVGPGTGDQVSTNVNFSPWLVTPAPGICATNKKDCKKQVEDQKKAFDKQQEADKKALDQQQQADKKAFDATHPSPQDRKAFDDQQHAAKKAFDDQQKADKKSFDDQNKADDKACDQLPK